MAQMQMDPGIPASADEDRMAAFKAGIEREPLDPPTQAPSHTSLISQQQRSAVRAAMNLSPQMPTQAINVPTRTTPAAISRPPPISNLALLTAQPTVAPAPPPVATPPPAPSGMVDLGVGPPGSPHAGERISYDPNTNTATTTGKPDALSRAISDMLGLTSKTGQINMGSYPGPKGQPVAVYSASTSAPPSATATGDRGGRGATPGPGGYGEAGAQMAQDRGGGSGGGSGGGQTDEGNDAGGVGQGIGPDDW